MLSFLNSLAGTIYHTNLNNRQVRINKSALKVLPFPPQMVSSSS